MNHMVKFVTFSYLREFKIVHIFNLNKGLSIFISHI